MTEVPINQKEYLKKYLAIGKAPGEKKRKKRKPTTNRIQIIDDDAEITISNNTISSDDAIIIDEDAPQIVAIIDERPPSLRIDEKTKNPLWQPIGSISDDNVGEQKQVLKAFKIEPKTNEKQFLRPDKSPPRRKKRANDDDHSPPRRSKNGEPSWRDVAVKEEPISEHGSPPRQHEDVPEVSPSRKSRSRDDDCSPPRKIRVSRDGDNSPPRRKRREEASPAGKNRDGSRSGSKYGDNSPPRRHKRGDEDVSPPRKSRDSKYSSPRRHKERDFSPPRRGKDEIRNTRDGTSDVSPSRKSRREDKGKKMTKTLDGKAAGLQNARELIEETRNFHSRENQLFKALSEDVSGVNAETVHRDRRTGRVRNLEEEEEFQRKKREEEAKNKEKYERWGRGLAQVENREQQIKEQLHEMSKPLARYADDEDLEKYLKEQEREGDPMLAYLRKKKRKKAVDAGVAFKPQFEGEFMPNRYGIRPGHRWDGVDRSSGYEKKWFDVQNEKKAILEDTYRWSTEDM